MFCTKIMLRVKLEPALVPRNIVSFFNAPFTPPSYVAMWGQVFQQRKGEEGAYIHRPGLRPDQRVERKNRGTTQKDYSCDLGINTTSSNLI